jgi:succinate dehydrogenase / fumarate reductase cytochrome b subunit
MAKSAILKSSIAKKYWMALTGLFLCLFLLGHLFGNLQLIYSDVLHFNQYALFMTSNPAIKALSYITYTSILFHAVDGFVLTYQNMKARPIGYVRNNPSANTMWSSRNMAILGTLILIFIVTHMITFWAPMHFDKNMPLQIIEVELMGQKQQFYTETNGAYQPVVQVAKSYAEAKATNKPIYIVNRTEFFSTQAQVKVGDAYKDLYKITIDFFKDPKYGALFTWLYVLSMLVLAFHLDHGFASAFQSLGINHPKYSHFISGFGRFFAIAIPLLFAIIPVCLHYNLIRFLH